MSSAHGELLMLNAACSTPTGCRHCKFEESPEADLQACLRAPLLPSLSPQGR